MDAEEYHKAIDEILWTDWDPIGVNEFPEARDEYYDYIPDIITLKMKDATAEEIAQRLNEIMTKRMALIPDIQHCMKIAEKIVSL